MKHPGRKIYHLLGGLFIIAAYIFLGRARGLPALAALTAIATATDISRFIFPKFNYFVFRHFRAFIRESERNTLTGTPPYLMGMLGSFFLFSLPVAICSIIFLACGDVSATIVGERWGKTKISGDEKPGGDDGLLCRLAYMPGQSPGFTGRGFLCMSSRRAR